MSWNPMSSKFGYSENLKATIDDSNRNQFDNLNDETFGVGDSPGPDDLAFFAENTTQVDMRLVAASSNRDQDPFVNKATPDQIWQRVTQDLDNLLLDDDESQKLTSMGRQPQPHVSMIPSPNFSNPIKIDPWAQSPAPAPPQPPPGFSPFSKPGDNQRHIDLAQILGTRTGPGPFTQEPKTLEEIEREMLQKPQINGNIKKVQTLAELEGHILREQNRQTAGVLMGLNQQKRIPSAAPVPVPVPHSHSQPQMTIHNQAHVSPSNQQTSTASAQKLHQWSLWLQWVRHPQTRAVYQAHCTTTAPLPPVYPPLSWIIHLNSLIDRGLTPQQVLNFPPPPPLPPPPLQRAPGGGGRNQDMTVAGKMEPNPTPKKRTNRTLINDLLENPVGVLMSKKERDWLVKIHHIQLQLSGDPYVDDYYWTMLREKRASNPETDDLKSTTEILEKLLVTPIHESPKKSSENGGNQVNKSSDKGFIMPPLTPSKETVSKRRSGSERSAKKEKDYKSKFENSLGRPVHLSANFPRQLISLTNSLDDTSTKEDDNVFEENTEPLENRHRLLLEIEELWLELLMIEDSLRLPSCDSDDSKKYPEERPTKILVEKILQNDDDPYFFPKLLSRPKGICLVVRLLKFVRKPNTDCVSMVFKEFLRWMPAIVNLDEDCHKELVRSFFEGSFILPNIALNLKLDSLTEMIEFIRETGLVVKYGDMVTSNLFYSNLILLVMARCASMHLNPDLDILQSWCDQVVQAETQPRPYWLKNDAKAHLTEWLSDSGIGSDLVKRFVAKISFHSANFREVAFQ